VVSWSLSLVFPLVSRGGLSWWSLGVPLVVFLLASSWLPLGLLLVFTLCIPSKIKTGAKLKNALLRLFSIRTPSANKDLPPFDHLKTTLVSTTRHLDCPADTAISRLILGLRVSQSQNGDLRAPMGVKSTPSTTYTLSDFFTKFLRTPQGSSFKTSSIVSITSKASRFSRFVAVY
jgi:hypothetical protein